jgi:hypothetical protein
MNKSIPTLFLAFSLLACNRSTTEPVVPGPGAKIIDLKSFSSYRGFTYKGGHRKGVVMMTYPDSVSGSLEVWVQDADSSTALMEWTAKSGNVSVDSVGPGTQKVVLRDVRYEKGIGAEGAVFPASPLELRLTRIGEAQVRLEIPSPSGMPAPLPLQDGFIILEKDSIIVD